MSAARTNVSQSRLLGSLRPQPPPDVKAPPSYTDFYVPTPITTASPPAPLTMVPSSPRSPKTKRARSPRRASPKRQSPSTCCVCADEGSKTLMGCRHSICQPCHRQVLLTDPRCPQCREKLEVPEDVARRVNLISECKKETETQASSAIAVLSTHPSARGRDVYSYYTKIYPWIEKACIEANNSRYFDPHSNKQAVYENSIFRSRAEIELRPALTAKVLQDIGRQLGMEVPAEMKKDFINSNRAKVERRIEAIDREDRLRISQAISNGLRYAPPREPDRQAYLDKLFYDSLFLTVWLRSLAPVTL